MEISKKGKILELLIALAFIFIGVVLRLVPHPPNLAPIAAIALFGGVYLSKKVSLVLPIAMMAISDIFLGFYYLPVMVSVYGSFLLTVILGLWLKKRKKWHTVAGASILSSVLFFLITNFAVWAFTPWYSKTLSGILRCYLMAIPFFRNTLLGDLFYVFVFFAAYEMIEVWIAKKFTINRMISPLA